MSMDEGAPKGARTLVALVQARAARTPEREGWSFLDRRAEVSETLTYAAIDQRARAIGAVLAERCQPGARAMLLYPPGVEFVAGLLGCFYARVVAVPAFPPDTARMRHGLPRLDAIARDAGCNTVLTTRILKDASLAGLTKQAPALAAKTWLATDEVSAADANAWRDRGVRGRDIALLQYTSGSTGQPKGVVLTHDNLLHNSRQIATFFGHTHGSRGVSWLPPYHDMGLIGGILQPLFCGFPVALMSPLTFLQRPLRWLQAVSRLGATTSGGPDFAYRMCIAKITEEQKEGLDLSSWSVAFTGAEPVRADTLTRFADAFSSCGFRREAFYPCYGLAEATLIVSGGQRGTPPHTVEVDRASLSSGRAAEGCDAELVGCGRADPEQKIRVVDPATGKPLPDRAVGEVWCSGPSVAQGYWNRERESNEAFRARLASDVNDSAPYLRTGDLGFMLKGELFITGRSKDVIIIRGRNYYPQDVEHTVEELVSHYPEIRLGGVCAIADDASGEAVVLVIETRRRLETSARGQLTRVVSERVAEEYGVRVARVLLVRAGTLPKTSSGKLRRHQVSEQIANGMLDMATTSPPTSVIVSEGGSVLTPPLDRLHTRLDVQQWLVAYAATRLSVDATAIDVRAPFTQYALDSVDAIALITELGDRLGRQLSPTLLWEHPNIAALAEYLTSAGRESSDRESASTSHANDPSSATVEQEMPLRPASEASDARSVEDEHSVAVVGLSCRFPGGANSPAAFWSVLEGGVDAIGPVPAERPDSKPVADCRYHGGFLTDVDAFDAHLFGVTPREAAAMDPQQRLLLECAWEALEHSGNAPTALGGSATGVFVGLSNVDYMRLQSQALGALSAYAGTGNASSVAANRISYALDLRGPSLAVDTACSSSLMAVHLACASLRRNESSLALAAGVNLILAPEVTQIFDQASMLAPDSRCKTFDARADGYVRGEGCGVVVLKRLKDALRDGDCILAVIRGSASNQDGRANGLTAPNGVAQRAVLRAALADAKVAPASISCIEAHGTGTPLGDPIEVNALSEVLADANSCALGSVKTNLGHLEAAAGIAGLIKVVLALQAKTIPAHLHFEKLNSHLELTKQFWIPTQASLWSQDGPRRAGVSSFGFGGSNVHVVLEEAPLPKPSARSSERALHILRFSAKSDVALRELAARHALALKGEVCLADYCYSNNVGRASLEERAAIVVRGREQAIAELTRLAEAEPPSRQTLDNANDPTLGDDVVRGRVAYGRGVVFGFGSALDTLCSLQGLDEVAREYESCCTALEGSSARAAAWALAAARALRHWGIEPTAVSASENGRAAAACFAEAYTDSETSLRNGPVPPVVSPGGDIARTADVVWFGDDAPPGAWTVRDLPSLFSALARLEVRGVPINWRAFDATYPRRRVDVPTYPFQRERFWFERGVAQSQRACSYQIKWRDAPAERSPTVLGPYVVVAGDSPDALAHKQRIEKQLASRGASLDEAARTAIFLASGPWRSDLQRLLKLVQGGTRVHLITVHAQPVGDREVDPGAAALWGFGRTVALEHRERWGQMIDLGSVQDLSAAVDEILSAATDDHVAFSAGRRHVARLVKQSSPVGGHLPVRSDVTYLISGGTGALGLAAAKGLVARGAKHIALLSRRVVPIDLGPATVYPCACDVGDEHALRVSLKQLAAVAPPVRGVIHAAGALGDGVIDAQSWSNFSHVLGGKADGAWNLHNLTEELDFFVMFSSLAGLVGSAGQAPYCVANSFLDGLAHHRRRAGQAALSVAWAPFDGDGMASGQTVRARRVGIEPLSVDELMDWVDRLTAETHVGVMAIDWPRLSESGLLLGARSLLTELLAKPRASLLAELRRCTPEARRARISDHIALHVAQVIGATEPGHVDRRAGLLDLGVDSLMAVELKNRLQRDLDVSLQATLIFNYPTIERLASHLSEQLAPQGPEVPASDDGLGALLDQIERLDDDEARHLLNTEVSP